MLPTTVLQTAAATTAAVYSTHMPSPATDVTRDPWQCSTENISQYFDVPKPTGELLDALVSYGESLYATCTGRWSDCPTPNNQQWCAFTTAPTSLLSDYSAYGNAASSWWAEHSAAAVSVARSCPVGWRKAMTDTLLGEQWLKDTIIFGGCYAEAHETDGTGPEETAGAVRTETDSVETTLTDKSDSSGSTLRQPGTVGMWMLTGALMVATAVNSVSYI